ncbi:MATE family efflux transporter [Novosphingobium sp. AAP1]|uniref:MATE family efflux transporter n=1 Tax=Novosphingobium sp. AAP1 TaxID=1523413 RepID=UPI003510C276
MWITAGFCVPIWIALWHAATILLALGQDAVLAGQAQMLLRGLQWALLPYMWFYGLRHFLGAMERPLWGVIITVAALPVNFLLVPHIGAPGSAPPWPFRRRTG